MLAHINIGSNLGDSRSVIERAVAGIFSLSEGITRRSSFVESEPWGFESVNRFLNIGVEIETSLPPERLLSCLQKIEKEISSASHRNADGSYRDRLIDIDLIFMAVRMDSPDDAPRDEACAGLCDKIDAGFRNEIGLATIRYHSPSLTLPHPRALKRQFVTGPIRELHPGLVSPEQLLLSPAEDTSRG